MLPNTKRISRIVTFNDSHVSRRLKKPATENAKCEPNSTLSRGSGQVTVDSETPVGKTSVTRSGQFVQEGPMGQSG